MAVIRLLSPFTLLLLACSVRCEDTKVHDVREGDELTLGCQIHTPSKQYIFYWVHTNNSGIIENAAIGELHLKDTYRIMHTNEGRYDLLLTNISYDRDNGKFECRVQKGGSGKLTHVKVHQVVVLTEPEPPMIANSRIVQAQEGRELKLTCSTKGGSPQPTIKWYRDGAVYPLEANETYGKTRDVVSTSTLTLTPAREDDGANFRCVVWNRALPEGQELDTSIDLSVQYFPRIDIGPDNPLRVEIDGMVTMECKVDAKPQVSSIRWSRNGKYISDSFTYTIPDVTVQDAGKYTCSADNGLGQPGEKEVYLDVLYPPSVKIESKTYEAEEGGTVEIHCEVSANPDPISVEWTMEGNLEFLQKGNTLVLRRVNAEMAGTYICRAANVISSSNGKSVERASSASVAVLVRHRPGRARITPERPVAQEGAAVTLTCSAQPPGWPAPQFRWFRDNGPSDTKPAILATGTKYTVPSAHLGSEGVYRCQATNELGHGEFDSVTLEVHQPPHFQTKLPLHTIKRSGDQDYNLSCTALGKPRPHIKWSKDGIEIKPDANLYEVNTQFAEAGNSVFNVQSTLKFNGKARPNTNDLTPEDRGMYTCTFENEVKKVDSTMMLRIEHEPIPIKLQTKVAYDLMETAEVTCRIAAYPKPEFQWMFGSTEIQTQTSGEDRYDVATSSDGNDSYYSILRIKNITSRDYGNYSCRVSNSLGSINPVIRLQLKDAPDTPKSLTVQRTGSTSVVLLWEPGFNGGLPSKYFVRYRRVKAHGVAGADGCGPNDATEWDWKEYDCGRHNPCNVTQLDQQRSYTFKVKAVNTKGQSNYSTAIGVTTEVENIPGPQQVTYDPSSKTVVFTVAPTCLSLVGVAEGLDTLGGWQVVDTIKVQLSGKTATFHEAVLDPPSQTGHTARRFGAPLHDELNPKLRIKLCLQPTQSICSAYSEAEIGTYTKDAAALAPGILIFIVICGVATLLFLGLLIAYCYCKRNTSSKKTSKDYEMDSMSPPMSTQNQAPPPYYPSTGMDNKALEHSMDLALEDAKNAVYATQGGYGYHVAPHAQPHSPQNMPNSEWVHTGYIENSYTNSNNGGSVNSQDSLWQMKMAAANNAGGMPAHQITDRQSNYGYDPIAHGGYGTIDDYAPYPHLGHGGQPPAADYNLRGSQNPSRQEYCSDPYASVHKPKKRMDQHIESPYHEVSGLPEAYGGGGDEGGPEDKPPHLSLSYDESLESGYSTPNSRARRVIREIIV